MKKRLLFTLLLILGSYYSMACTGGSSNEGSLSPTTIFQTVSTSNGDYFQLNVTCGYTYTFDFCNNGGSTGNLYPEISILNPTGTTEHAFSPYANGCSVLTWTADFTGTVRVLITESGCNQNGAYTGTMAYNVTGGSISPTFNLIPTIDCGSVNAQVTGTPGGTFSFNPAPSDGAVINPTSGTVTNGTIGSTYNVRYSVCSSSHTVPITLNNSNCWSINGDSKYVEINGEQCIELTENSTNQTGCSWNGFPVDFSSTFTLSLEYYFGNNINGADGNTFTFQPNPNASCGENGAQLGAGGIPNALSIEFDTYDNDGGTNWDLSCDHIAIEIDGDHIDDPSNFPSNEAPLAGPVCAKSNGGNIDDGGVYDVDITWDAITQTLQVFFDGDLRLTTTNDFVTNAFGGQNIVYWGATSATGGLSNRQYFCPSTVVVLPVEMGSFDAVCNDDQETIKWTTISESRVDYFQIEYTYDNLIFYPIDRVQAVGNSQEEINYSLDVTTNDAKQRYYRLKMVDLNGEFEYTDLIASKRCHVPSSLLHSISQKDGIKVSTIEETTITLINQLGQVVSKANTVNQSTLFNTTSLGRGIYFIHVTNNNGQEETKKVFIQ